MGPAGLRSLHGAWAYGSVLALDPVTWRSARPALGSGADLLDLAIPQPLQDPFAPRGRADQVRFAAGLPPRCPNE
jgi:hypothetical protein